jgi:hypothetical protein
VRCVRWRLQWTANALRRAEELATVETRYKPVFRTLSFALVCGLAVVTSDAVASPSLSALGSAISGSARKNGDDKDPPLIAKAEVLLDRAHFSAGEIDGFDGDNFRDAIRALLWPVDCHLASCCPTSHGIWMRPELLPITTREL